MQNDVEFILKSVSLKIIYQVMLIFFMTRYRLSTKKPSALKKTQKMLRPIH